MELDRVQRSPSDASSAVVERPLGHGGTAPPQEEATDAEASACWQDAAARPLWMAYDQVFSIVAVVNITSMIHMLDPPATSLFLWTAVACIAAQVAQLAWMLCHPSSFTWRVRTACTIVGRAIRVASLYALVGGPDAPWRPFTNARLDAYAAGGSPIGAALRGCTYGSLAVYPLYNALTCYLPLRWSLPFILLQVTIILHHHGRAVEALTQASVLPGTRALQRGACTVLLWLAGPDISPRPAASAAHLAAAVSAPHAAFSNATMPLALGVPTTAVAGVCSASATAATAAATGVVSPAPSLCDPITPQWLVLFSILFLGLVLPLYISACWDLHVTQHVQAKREGHLMAAVQPLEAAASLLLVHVPALAAQALALGLSLALVIMDLALLV